MSLRVVQKIRKLQQALKQMPVEQFFVETTEENTHFIEDKNILNLKAGLNSDGTRIEPEYSPFTVAAKKAEGKTYDRVTLEDTGKFHRSIATDVMSQGFNMVAKDNKWGKLVEKYGDKIVDLGKKSIAELREEVYVPNVLFKIRNYLKNV